MGFCPFCDEDWPIPAVDFEIHVQSHDSQYQSHSLQLDVSQSSTHYQADLWYEGTMENRSNPRGGPSRRDSGDTTPSGDEPTCPVCNYPLDRSNVREATKHCNECLDEQIRVQNEANNLDGMTGMEASLYKGGQSQWDGPAAPGGWQNWKGYKAHKADQWWHPVFGQTGSDHVPFNYSPGLIPVLEDLLNTSSARGFTRAAVLSMPTVHIASVFPYDFGWGCGYRNALIMISALVAANPLYRIPFSSETNGCDPGIRRVQGWLEETWSQVFDVAGGTSLQGKVQGTRKWIGTADLCAMFTWKSIPCQLYDFREAKRGTSIPPASVRLTQWVKSYFLQASTASNGNAFEVLMRTQEGGKGRGDAIRLSNRMPLMLQHRGHSRTIVGYEETSKGEVNLLIFDCGKAMAKSLRNAGIAKLQHSQSSSSTQMPPPPPPTKKPSFTNLPNGSHESLAFSPPFTNGASEIAFHPQSGPSRSYTVRKASGSSLKAKLRPFEPSAPASLNTSRSSAISSEMTIIARRDTATNYSEDFSETEVLTHRGGGGGIKRTSSGVELRDDEEKDEKGWIRRKASGVSKVFKMTGKPKTETVVKGKGRKSAAEELDVHDGLNVFRVNLKSLDKHSEYQILAFTNGPLLTEQERQQRRHITGTTVWDV